MKLVSWVREDGTERGGSAAGEAEAGLRLGALVLGGEAVVDLSTPPRRSGQAHAAGFESMRALMAAGDAGLAQAGERVERAAADGDVVERRHVRLKPPLGRPTLICDFATMDTHMRNYMLLRARERARGAADPEAQVEAERRAGKLDLPRNWLTVYAHHIGNPLNVIGPDDVLQRPRGVQELDYELELAAVVGTTGRDLDPETAERHIFGYTLMNDFTARDIQRAENKPAGKSKDFDGSYSLGPCIVTRDEIGDLGRMRLRVRLNGVPQSEDGAASMQIGFPQLLAYISRSTTVHAGEVFASGTFANGCGFELGRLLEDGDVIELEADGIGTLRNFVRAAA